MIPAYMGLVRQLDDHLSRLWAFMEERGLWDNTLVVVTSDHGDYLGDHWLGEKELIHEESVRIPLVIYDPTEAADATRGTVDDGLVEAIDLAPHLRRGGGRRGARSHAGRAIAGAAPAREGPAVARCGVLGM